MSREPKSKADELTLAHLRTARNQLHAVWHSSDVSMPYYRFQLLKESYDNISKALEKLEK